MSGRVRRCSKCGEEKILTPENFTRDKSKPMGFSYYCCFCSRILIREARENRTPEKQAADRRRATELERRKPRKVQKQTEKGRQKRKQWREENRDRVKAVKQAWYERHPNKIDEQNTKRRTRKRGLPFDFTAADEMWMREFWQHKCAVCSALEQLESDHWIALSDKRPGNPGTVVTNMVPLCRHCNASKNGKSPAEWLIETYGFDDGMRIFREVHVYFMFAAFSKRLREKGIVG